MRRAMWRRAMWLFPCWVACTSATPPPEAARSTQEAEPTPAPPPICEPGATRACYPGPEGTAGIGACKAGVEACEATGFGVCTGAVVPAADEDCRTPYDEDCDGRMDDCPELAVAFATAFTSDRPLFVDGWGGGLGIVRGARLWVVEPGGRVVDVNASEAVRWGEDEDEEGEGEDYAEDFEEADEVLTMAIGGAWPGALLRTYETGGTRAGSMTEQERWDGVSFSDVDDTDEYLQWAYEEPIPWRDGHCIALKTWGTNFDVMQDLDDSTLEYGGIEAGEQRKLQRKVDRLLARAKPRLVIVTAEGVEPLEPVFEVFSAGGDAEDDEDEDEADEAGDEGGAEVEGGAEGEAKAEGAKAEVKTGTAAGTAGTTEAVPPTPAASEVKPPAPVPATPEAAKEVPAKAPPKVQQPPALPTDKVRSFIVLSDASVVLLGFDGLHSWKPKQRQWTPIEPPSPGFLSMTASLYAGLDGELLVLACKKDAPSELWRRDASAWSSVPLPTSACPDALAVTPDGTRWMIIDDQLWQRRPGDAEPWKRVPLPMPWKPRQVIGFDGRVWVAAEGEGGQWAVLVDRPVPRPRRLPLEE